MPVIPVAGSEQFANQPVSRVETRRLVGDTLPLHDVDQSVVDNLDPLTYEVIRHRLTSITEEMGEALKRMSGSVVVTDCNDFDAAIMDEVGDVVQVGLYNTELAASLDMAANWTLRNRARRPGINPGDMFLCNDPWVGGGLHQNDVSLFAPLFIDGELFAWTGAVAHQVDLGGVSPGSWSVGATDVFWESVPTPPVKIVEAGQIRDDIEDLYLRRSRVPNLVALDLRAKIGANNVAHERLRTLCEKYGAGTVKAVMRRLLQDAETRLRAKLAELPDGEWSSVAHQDSARSGDRGIYKIVCSLRKTGDKLTLDFTGTDPQVDGLINCTFAGLRGGIMPVLLTTLCGDIPWAPGGLWRCIEIISEPGTINNCSFPAGIGKASVASAWATTNVVTECLGGLLDAHPEHRKRLMSVCCGTWDFALLAGVDQRGAGFVTMICDSMAGGLGARSHADGVDTGGLACIPMGRIADVEMNEFSFPMLYLWRREEPDSGGPGRFRGGVGASSCFIPHDSPLGGVHLVVSAPGKALPLAGGLAGGLPAGTQHDVILRSTGVDDTFRSGRIPATLADVGGQSEILPSHHETDLAATDVYFTHWQGGGGYGDPLLREPAAVAADVVAHKVSAGGADEVYGVVLTPQGTVDSAATEARRSTLRLFRAGLTGDRQEIEA
jgi:N-methylhydantoinase B